MLSIGTLSLHWLKLWYAKGREEKNDLFTEMLQTGVEGLTPLNRRSLQTVQGLYCLVEFGQVTLPLIESIKQW